MKTAMLGLHAETHIHAGAGSALDVIDLPIQREAHSGWPCIFGSSMKGALRSAADAGQAKNVELVFGPSQNDNSKDAYAGALMVGDARLLLLPVRSLTSHFKWVACPAVLQRLKRDAERLGMSGFPAVMPAEPKEGCAFVVDKAGDLFLEEYKFTAEKQDDLLQWVSYIAQFSAIDGFENNLKQQLVIIRNDDFAHLVRHATPVTPHIALDSASKSVLGGALWYEETLPPETLLYVCLTANAARKKDSKLDAEAVITCVSELFKPHPYLQVGGNETVGMGWFKVKLLEKEVSQ